MIEVSLRASEESGLLGVDLTTAPFEEIADEVVAAVERRAIEAQNGPAQTDGRVHRPLGGRDARARYGAGCLGAHAHRRTNPREAARVLACCRHQWRANRRMLTVIARMKPAALARLLMLVAAQAGTDPRRIAAAMSLPPETAKALALLLAPMPDIAPDFGVPDTTQAAQIAEEMARPEHPDPFSDRLRSRLLRLRPVALSQLRPRSPGLHHAESVAAIGEVLPAAARDGALPTVREALRRLDELSAEPSLADAVQMARGTLADPAVLRDVCRACQTDADAAIAGEILQAAGQPGAEALLDSYIRMSEPQRSLFRPVLRGTSEMVLGVARPRLRTAKPAVAVTIVRALAVLGDRRAAAVIAGTLESSLDEQVRFAAANALANIQAPEAGPSTSSGRWDTARSRPSATWCANSAGFVLEQPCRRSSARLTTSTFSQRATRCARTSSLRCARSAHPKPEKALRRFASRPGFGRKGPRAQTAIEDRRAGPRPVTEESRAREGRTVSPGKRPLASPAEPPPRRRRALGS